MNHEFQVLTLVPGYCLVATLLVATFTDIVSHRIPNVLLAPALITALLVGATMGGLAGVVTALCGLGIGLAMLLPLYAMGAMGAGDVKLLGVAGAFLGPYGALITGVMTFIAGAIFGLLWISWRALRPTLESLLARLMETRQRVANTPAPAIAGRRKSSFAYAPAIATGAAFAIWQQGWFSLIHLS